MLISAPYAVGLSVIFHQVFDRFARGGPMPGVVGLNRPYGGGFDAHGVVHHMRSHIHQGVIAQELSQGVFSL